MRYIVKCRYNPGWMALGQDSVTWGFGLKTLYCTDKKVAQKAADDQNLSDIAKGYGNSPYKWEVVEAT